MSDKPVNLNRFRKEKARAEKRARADTNAAKFGRPKSERLKDKALSDLADRRLADHSLKALKEGPDSGGEES